MKKELLIFLTKSLPNKIFIPLHFLFETRKILNTNNPKTFSEKIQWLKLYGKLEKHSQYVDKYEVREYIKKTIGEKYLIPLVGRWNTPEDIQLHKLPKRIVFKATHGSGYNFICKDSSNINKDILKKTLSAWIREKYYVWFREDQYRYVIAKIICEKYIEDEFGELRDYKFFCFHGKAKFIQIDSDRYKKHKRDIRDMKWNRLPIVLRYPNSTENMNKPKNLTKMIMIAEELSKRFPFVRVDLYSARERIYFGELTFTPGNGMEKFFPHEADIQFGKLLNLSKLETNKNL